MGCAGLRGLQYPCGMSIIQERRQLYALAVGHTSDDELPDNPSLSLHAPTPGQGSWWTRGLWIHFLLRAHPRLPRIGRLADGANVLGDHWSCALEEHAPTPPETSGTPSWKAWSRGSLRSSGVPLANIAAGTRGNRVVHGSRDPRSSRRQRAISANRLPDTGGAWSVPAFDNVPAPSWTPNESRLGRTRGEH